MYEWAGGQDAFERLTVAFYARVREDELLAPVFADMPDDHPHNVAVWLAEVFGARGHRDGATPHADQGLDHRGAGARWAQLIGIAADDAGLPSDPEFRSAFMAYLEWGTRIALANSQPGAEPPPEAPVPRWGWGEAPPWPG